MKKIKNKKGEGNDIMAFWLFLIWVIVGGIVVIGVTAFYSAQVDIRGLESEIFSKKVAGCLINSEGQIKTEYFEDVTTIGDKNNPPSITGSAISGNTQTITNNLIKDNKMKFLSECKLNYNQIITSGNFYIQANITLLEDWQDKDNPKTTKKLEIGNRDLTIQCGVKSSDIEAKNFGFCIKRNIYGVIIENGIKKEGIIQLFTGVNNG